jgi:hypothetical protein
MRTDKILLPQLILEAEGFDKQLLDVSMKRIGDPFDESQWAPFDGANEEQKKNLRNARKVLLGWIMQEIIRLFFEVLCKDNDRKKYWEKHSHKIRNFMVFGSVFSKQQVLKHLPAQTVNRHFRTVDSSVDNCALAMYIGEYVIIEFTEVGALYAYIVGSKKYQEAFKYVGSLGKIDDLKLPGMPKLYDDDYYKAFAKEGKMNHQGFWQQRMNYWLNRQVKLTDE